MPAVRASMCACVCVEAFRLYLFVDRGTESNGQEPVGNDRKNTQDGGEQDGQPEAGLAQGVSG